MADTIPNGSIAVSHGYLPSVIGSLLIGKLRANQPILTKDIIFPDDGLRKRDKLECKGLWSFIGKWDSKSKKRLKHIVDISNVNPDKESVLIVDESDDVIMKNPKKFAQSILNEKIKVICLTATPDDGLE